MKNLRLLYCMVFFYFYFFYCVPTSDIESYNSETLNKTFHGGFKRHTSKSATKKRRKKK